MRRIYRAIGLFIVVAMLASCATTVQVRHLVPSEVDLQGRKNLAIASAAVGPIIKRPRLWVEGLDETSFVLGSGWQADLPTLVGQGATRRIVDSMVQTGHFSILGPQGTDLQMQLICTGGDGCSILAKQGVTALMVTDISYLDATEQIVGKDILGQVEKTITFVDEDEKEKTVALTSNEVVSREYTLIQRVTMTLTYTIHDTTDGQILASRTFTDSAEAETLIGRRVYSTDAMGAHDERIYLMRSAPSLLGLYETMLDKMARQISAQLAPTWRSSYISLMEIKPKSAQSKAAVQAVNRGEYQVAYGFYSLVWEREHALAAGYNAAVLLEAMGELEQALALMDEVYHTSASPQAYSALLRIQEAKSLHEKAERQISGEMVDDGQSVMMTQWVISE